jgi:hypothetical protein
MNKFFERARLVAAERCINRRLILNPDFCLLNDFAHIAAPACEYLAEKCGYVSSFMWVCAARNEKGIKSLQAI